MSPHNTNLEKLMIIDYDYDIVSILIFKGRYLQLLDMCYTSIKGLKTPLPNSGAFIIIILFNFFNFG